MRILKKKISECIDDYEKNITGLKKDIEDYNKTAENIKNDIIKIKKKSMEIQYSSCKCEICQEYIKDEFIYLFPCGHMFDAKCIRNCLLDYEISGMDYIHEKNVRIDEIFFKLGLINQRVFIFPKKENNVLEKEAEEKKIEEQNKGGTIFNKFKFNIDLPVFKKQEVTENKPEEDPKKLKKELNKLLSQQCILCGDYMVDSVQYSIFKPDIIKPNEADKSKIRLKVESSWEFIK